MVYWHCRGFRRPPRWCENPPELWAQFMGRRVYLSRLQCVLKDGRRPAQVQSLEPPGELRSDRPAQRVGREVVNLLTLTNR
jgi:hypothetical protein